MNWHVVITGINQEYLAEYGLRAKNFETYCPQGRKVVRHGRKEKLRSYPIFSRYLFVRFDSRSGGYSDPIRSTDGIIEILSNNWRPVAVADWIIDDIRSRQLAGEFDRMPENKKKQPKYFKSFAILKKLLDPQEQIHV